MVWSPNSSRGQKDIARTLFSPDLDDEAPVTFYFFCLDEEMLILKQVPFKNKLKTNSCHLPKK